MQHRVFTAPSLAFLAVEDSMRKAKRQAQAPLGERRAKMAASAMATPLPAGVTAHPVTLNGVNSLHWSVPDPCGALFYVHGGAYQLGSPQTHRALPAAIALATQCDVYALDYRLAPEHPFPAALNDAIAAWVGLTSLLGTALPLAVFGDSAGAGLALSMAVSCRDVGAPAPRCLVLLSPWTDLSCSLDSHLRLADCDVLMTKAALLDAAEVYLAGTPATDPSASPLQAQLAALVPVLIQVGENEILLDDALALEAALERAGVSVRLERWQHMAHGWQHFPHVLPEARQAIATISLFIRTHLN